VKAFFISDDEINICYPDKAFERLLMEFRIRKDGEAVLLTVNGSIVQTFSVIDTGFSPKLTKNFEYFKWNIYQEYTPDKNKKSDAYLFK
jgi:hypothetical protein